MDAEFLTPTDVSKALKISRKIAILLIREAKSKGVTVFDCSARNKYRVRKDEFETFLKNK